MGTIKDRNSMDLIEAEDIKKRCNAWGRKLEHDWVTELNWTEPLYCSFSQAQKMLIMSEMKNLRFFKLLSIS